MWGELHTSFSMYLRMLLKLVSIETSCMIVRIEVLCSYFSSLLVCSGGASTPEILSDFEALSGKYLRERWSKIIATDGSHDRRATKTSTTSRLLTLMWSA